MRSISLETSLYFLPGCQKRGQAPFLIALFTEREPDPFYERIFLKIEAEIFNFSKDFNPSLLRLSELQTQYLSYLLGQDSIEQLVVRLLNNGWLVNFQELYGLVEKLVQSRAVLNPNIIHYFKNSQLTTALKSGAPSTETLTAQDLMKKVQELPFFRSLPVEFSMRLLQKATLKKVVTENLICKAGAADRNMYVLLRGQAAIYKDRKFISVITAPGIFGEASFLTGSAKSADVVSLQACDVLVVPYQAEILDPILNQNVTHEIVKRFWIQNALNHSDFFKKIPPDCLDALTFAGKIINLQNEQILFKQNDSSPAAYLVVQGQIRIVQNAQIIATLTQGSFFGEISLTMTNGIRTASAFSYGSTTLLEITRHDFYTLLSRNLFLAKEIQNLAFARLHKDQVRATPQKF